MITPTFAKLYRSHHLGAIWAAALQRLSLAAEWVFIGYSLPPDDIAIKTMLLKAFRICAERKEMPEVAVVNYRPDEDLLLRYRRLFRRASLFAEGFEVYVTRMGAGGGEPSPVAATG